MKIAIVSLSKKKTIAKMFVLWLSGDSEEGYREEIVWKIGVGKHKAAVSRSVLEHVLL